MAGIRCGSQNERDRQRLGGLCWAMVCCVLLLSWMKRGMGASAQGPISQLTPPCRTAPHARQKMYKILFHQEFFQSSSAGDPILSACLNVSERSGAHWQAERERERAHEMNFFTSSGSAAPKGEAEERRPSARFVTESVVEIPKLEPGSLCQIAFVQDREGNRLNRDEQVVMRNKDQMVSRGCHPRFWWSWRRFCRLTNDSFLLLGGLHPGADDRTEAPAPQPQGRLLHRG